MTPLATVVLAWAAVYGYVCAYFCMLYARRRSDREYLLFGLLVGCLALYGVGDVVFLSKATYDRQALGLRIESIAITPGLPLFVDFCLAVARAPRGRLLKMTYMWAAVGLCLEGARLFEEPTAGHAALVGLLGAPPMLVRLSPLAMAFFCLGWLSSVLATHTLWRRSIGDPDLRILFVALAINVVAAGHDILTHAGFIDSYTLMSHTAILAVFSMSYVLLDRFARTIDALRLRTYELRMSHSELRDTHERLVRREALAAVGELSAVIAHEVRNPIAVIKNAVSGLRRPRLRDEDRRTLLDILDEETDKLFRLMQNLLAYARPIAPEVRSVELRRLIDESIDAGRSHAPQPHGPLQIDVDLADAPDTLYGDPNLLRNALVNLVDNALQAMPDGGVLGIYGAAARIDAHPAVELTICDDGVGMEADVRTKARDPFFTTRPRGTGLGLPIVERVIRNHGGHIALDSAPGVGTRVTVRIPCERISNLPPGLPEFVAPERSTGDSG